MEKYREHDIDAVLEIEIAGFSQNGVNLKLRLMRKKLNGFREDAMNAIFSGVVLKEHEYNGLTVGSRIVYQGIKSSVKVFTEEDNWEKASKEIEESYSGDSVVCERAESPEGKDGRSRKGGINVK